LKGRRHIKCAEAIKGPRHLQTKKKKNKKIKEKRLPGYLPFAWTFFELFSSLPNTKNTSKPLDSIPSIFLSLVSYLGFEV